jgi:hypothetical protein
VSHRAQIVRFVAPVGALGASRAVGSLDNGSPGCVRDRDDGEVSDAEPAWSDQIGQASWIGERLAPFGSVVTSVVPSGFEAYARVLHPAQEPWHDGGRVVRWAEVAAWSGLPLRPGTQFHSIALPPVRPEGEAPWTGQGPDRGSLYPPDAVILAGILRHWTTAPQRCWFCVWDGYGWDHSIYLTASDSATAAGPAFGRRPDPVPPGVRGGRRVELPNRDYLLYRGPLDAALATARLGVGHQVANLWWPQDRAWFVASEIDLTCTYVGGPAGLIGQLLAETRIEALPAAPDDELAGIEDWVTARAEQAAGQLLASGQATMTTSRGTLRASLNRPGRLTSGMLLVRRTGDNGVTGSSSTRLSQRPEPDLREEISHYLALAIIELAGG